MELTMTAECTNLDHSEFKTATNFWGLERKREELKYCFVCRRMSFEEWFRQIDWKNTDRGYWKQIFKEGDEEKAFFFKAVPPDHYGRFDIHVDADVIPASILRPTRPLWLKTKISEMVRQHRYEERRPQTKKNDYGRLQRRLEMELASLIEDNDLEYVDNRRYAALDSRKDMRRYNDQKDRGCCGSFDREVTIGGRKFMVGCNYGH